MNKTGLKIALIKCFRVLSTITFVLYAFVSSGQNTQSHNEQVTIVGSYDPSINEAFKINSKPETNEIDFKAREFTFDLLDVKQNTKIELNPIKAVTLRSGSKTNKFDNFLKLGFGSRLSPYLDFYHSSGDKGNYNFNANIFHYSSFTYIIDYSPSPFTKTLAKVNYAKFLDKHILDIGLEYGLNTNRFYGFVPENWSPLISVPEDDLKQMFNLIKASAMLRSAYKGSSKVHHKIGLNTYYYFDKFQTTELNVQLNFNFYKAFDVVDALDYQNIGIEGSFDFFSNNDSLTENTEFYINAKPYFTAKYGLFSFNAGLNFGYLGDTASSFHFWPVIDVNMNIIPGTFSIYAGLSGKLEKQSYLALTTENPYLSPTSTLGWLNEKINVYGGFKFSIAQKVGFDLKLGWKSFENMAFFVNYGDYSIPTLNIMGPLNKFNTVFDDGSVFYGSAEVSLNIGKDFKLWLGGSFNNYNMDSLTHAYHKPLTIVRFGASYLIAEKVKISTELMYNGIRYAYDITGFAPKVVELDSYLDLNLTVEYKINENFSAFINGTNLLNKNYDQFYSYPVQGLQIMGGLMYRF